VGPTSWDSTVSIPGRLQLCKEWKEEMIMYFGIGCLFI
jgi:hypothetical protein